MKKRLAEFLSCVILAAFVFGASPVSASAQADDISVTQIADSLVSYIKSSLGKSSVENVFDGSYAEKAGTSDCDWTAIGLARYGYEDNYTAYLSMAAENVSQRYNDEGKLHFAKATEWHRISLAVAACGGNPLAIGSYGGAPINLIADGTYYRGITASPGRQGINGWIWGLIALDGKKYPVPDDAVHGREDFITQILKAQLADGGLAMTGDVSDVDVTAMAVQALAPYYNSEFVFNYTSSKIKDDSGIYITVEKTVREVIDEGLEFLSNAQLDDGDFACYGMPNAESTCQVIVALTALGIDPSQDERFIKNGNTVLDGLVKYRLSNGGFVHSLVYDPSNPTSLPDEANALACEQALYALAALHRFNGGMRSLYDMRAEFTADERTAIDAAITAISRLGDESDDEQVISAIDAYKGVDELDRQYVSNYKILSAAAERLSLKELLPDDSLNYSGYDGEDETILYEFTATEKAAADALPPVDELDTSYFASLVSLKNIIDNCADFEGKNEYKIKIDKAYNAVAAIRREIDDINAEILDKLYPFESIGLGDKATVYSIYERYCALSAYDKTKIVYFEDLQKCKTQIDNLQTALYISLGCGAAVALAVAFVVFDIIRRKKKKAAESMPESED